MSIVKSSNWFFLNAKCLLLTTHKTSRQKAEFYLPVKFKFSFYVPGVSARDPMLFQIRWPGMKSIGMVEVTRTTHNEVERSKRFYITSLDEDIDGFMRAVRKHWSIEINLHWSLDVSFKEDLNRARAGHSAQNLATIRRIALNLLTQEKTHKRGISCKRKTAGWNHKYLMEVLSMGKTKTSKTD